MRTLKSGKSEVMRESIERGASTGTRGNDRRDRLGLFGWGFARNGSVPSVRRIRRTKIIPRVGYIPRTKVISRVGIGHSRGIHFLGSGGEHERKRGTVLRETRVVGKLMELRRGVRGIEHEMAPLAVPEAGERAHALMRAWGLYREAPADKGVAHERDKNAQRAGCPASTRKIDEARSA